MLERHNLIKLQSSSTASRIPQIHTEFKINSAIPTAPSSVFVLTTLLRMLFSGKSRGVEYTVHGRAVFGRVTFSKDA